MNDLTEQNQLQSLLSKMERFQAAPMNTEPTVCSLCPLDVARLTTDLSASMGALLVRRVLEHLAFDEHLPFRWRLDHKLIQTLMLARYLPDLVPACIGLERATLNAGSHSVSAYLRSIWPSGFVVKRTRGYASARSAVLESGSTPDGPVVPVGFAGAYDGSLESESFVAQKKIDTVREYRIHTIHRLVLPSLTFATFGTTGSLLNPAERVQVENTVLDALRRLPDGLCSNSICGWDIGISRDGFHYIFEINYSGHYPACKVLHQCNGEPYDDKLSLLGNHPVCAPGFQCSGMLQNERSSALLLRFVADTYHVSFVFNHSSSSVTSEEAQWIAQLKGAERWFRLSRVLEEMYQLWSEADVADAVGEISLRERISLNGGEWTDRLYINHLRWLKTVADEIR